MGRKTESSNFTSCIVAYTVLRVGLQNFVEMEGAFYPDLVRVFYMNLTSRTASPSTKVKGVRIFFDEDLWNNVAGLSTQGINITYGFEDFNKLVEFRKFCKDPNLQVENLYKVGNVKLNERMLHYVIVWILVARGTNHAQLTKEDILLMYGFLNNVSIDWPSIILDNMFKAIRLSSFALPYAVFVSKILEYKGVDLEGENKQILLSNSKIGKNVLRHMGLIEQGNRFTQREEGAAAMEEDDEDQPQPPPQPSSQP